MTEDTAKAFYAQSSRNGLRCDDCDAECIDACYVCGAPQCCPACCLEATRVLLAESERA